MVVNKFHHIGTIESATSKFANVVCCDYCGSKIA